MRGKSTKPPSYRLHKASKQAVCTIAHRDHYLGPWMSPESRIKYEKLISAWMAGEPAPSPEASSADLTCAELALTYLRWAECHYVKDGQPTSELNNVKRALKGLREGFAGLPAKEFSPLKLKIVRQGFIDAGLCRSNCNRYTSILVRMFRYAVENELVPPDLAHSLEAVKSLEAGRCEAPDHPEIGPVSDEHIAAVLPFLPEPYRTMIRVMLLCGARPGEMCKLTPAQVDTSGEVWLYRVVGHKTAHRGKVRLVPFGPQARLLLKPFWPDFAGQLVFRNRRGRKIARNVFAGAIARACKRAGIPVFQPNMVRHSAATKILAAYDIESAKMILGHSNSEVTRIYAEPDREKTIAIAAKLG